MTKKTKLWWVEMKKLFNKCKNPPDCPDIVIKMKGGKDSIMCIRGFKPLVVK